MLLYITLYCLQRSRHILLSKNISTSDRILSLHSNDTDLSSFNKSENCKHTGSIYISKARIMQYRMRFLQISEFPPHKSQGSLMRDSLQSMRITSMVQTSE